MKKIITILIALAVYVGTMSAEKVQIGNLYYHIDKQTKTAGVTSQNPSYPYWSSPIVDVIIPESITFEKIKYSVTSIEKKAFAGCSSLISITIPNSVKSIGEEVFYNCVNLAYITIGKSVTSIGHHALFGCSGLAYVTVDPKNPKYRDVDGILFSKDYKELIQYPEEKRATEYMIPNTVTSIGNSAFSGCENLTSITIPNSVKSIGDRAFSGCSKLTSVTIPNGVTCIDIMTFFLCRSLVNVTIGNGVTSIGEMAFSDCKNLTSITIPNSVTSIGVRAFWGCSKLASVTIPKSVTSIGNFAFTACSKLTSVIVPYSVTSIGEGIFYSCSNLTAITIDSNNPNYLDIDGVVFSKDYREIVQYPAGKLAIEYTIPNTITSIRGYAFYGCYRLTSLTIPNSVTSIGDFAFAFCEGVTSITIPNSVTSIGRDVFTNCKNLQELRYYEGLDLSSAKVPETTKLVVLKDATPKQPPLLTLVDESLVYMDESKNNQQDANEKSTIRFKIKNQGKGAANSCQVRVKMTGSTDGINIGAVSLPTIATGQTHEVSIPVSSNIQTKDGKVTFTIEIFEPNGWGIAPFDITVATKSYDPPFLQVVDYNLASNSGKIRKMEPFTLTFNLQNTKYGDAEDVKVKVYLPSNVFVMDGNAEMSYSRIQSGEVKSIQLTLAANNNYSTQNIPITISIKEKYGKFAENKQLDIALNQTASSSINIAAKDEPQQERKEIQLALIKSDVDLQIPETKASNPNTFVVIIANENYKTVASVPFALNDGRIFAKYCQLTLGVPAKQIKLYENATYNDMRLAVTWLKNVCEKFEGETSVIVYYTGHGIPDESDKSAYLLPVDGDGRYVATGYKMDDLYDKLGAMPAKSITVLLDACFSGATRDGKMVSQAKGIAIKAKKGIPQGNTVVLSAAQGDETAGFKEGEGHGMFTYYLLKKLQETKGDVTLQELSQYIIREVGRASVVDSKVQTPCVTPSASLGSEWQNWKLK